MKIFFYTLFLLLFSATFTACHSKGNEAQNTTVGSDTLRTDTDITVLALLPTIDCLPYYYANQQGYFARQGLNIRVVSYTSQWDCDTAIIGNTAAIGVTDQQRVEHYKSQHQSLTILHTLPRQYALIVCGRLRLKTLKDLKLRTIGQTRLSQVAHWSQLVEQAAGIPSGEAMRPQVNDLFVRTSMLNENQLDAALLPEPYATVARLAGHKLLWTSPAEPQFTCLVMRDKDHNGVKNTKQRLLAAYNMAVDSLNARGKEAVRHILTETYRLQPTAIDSLKWPRLTRVN